VKIESTGWSGEGTFTQQLLDALERLPGVSLVRVEDAPASRSDADYNFISNEIFIVFDTVTRHEPVRRFGIIPGTKVVSEKALDVAGLGSALTDLPGIGEPDYSDDGMLQYLRTERIVPPYQTRGYKLVELVRIYEAGSSPRRPGPGEEP
jgi:hypothetical protein